MSETELKHDVHGWNFEVMDDGRVFVCKGGHHRSSDCELQEMKPAELVRLIKDMAAARADQPRPAVPDDLAERYASLLDMAEHYKYRGGDWALAQEVKRHKAAGRG